MSSKQPSSTQTSSTEMASTQSTVLYEARDRIAGFWRALGETPPPEPDHLTLMLASYAELRSREDAGEPPREHRLPRTGRPAQEQSVSSGGGDLECALGGLLAAHVAQAKEVGREGVGRLIAGAVDGERFGAAQV